MPTWDEIIADKKTYPNDMKYTFADGVEVTLGDLRGGYMRQSDYSRKTNEVSQSREEFAREKAQFELSRTEAEKQLQELAAQIVARAGQPAAAAAEPDEVEALLRRDPLAKRLNERIELLDKKIAERDKLLETAQQRLQQHETTYMADQHRRMLQQIRASDPQAPSEEEIVRFAQQNYIPRLDMAYRLLSEDRRIEEAAKKARDEASTAAYERAKRELAAPALPTRRVLTPLPEGQIPNWDDAYADPDVLAALSGQPPA